MKLEFDLPQGTADKVRAIVDEFEGFNALHEAYADELKKEELAYKQAYEVQDDKLIAKLVLQNHKNGRNGWDKLFHPFIIDALLKHRQGVEASFSWNENLANVMDNKANLGDLIVAGLSLSVKVELLQKLSKILELEPNQAM